MKLKFAFLGLVALAGAGLSAGSASAMPIGLALKSDIASNVEQVRLVCDNWGRCWRTPRYGYGPRYGFAPRYGYGPRYGFGGHRHHGWRGGRW